MTGWAWILAATTTWIALNVIAGPAIGRRLRALQPPAGREPAPTPAQPCPPGPPHNPGRIAWIVYGSPCGCWTKVEFSTGRELGRRACAQAPTWAQWESELR